MLFFIFTFFAISELKPTDDPYKILGIPKNASQAEIKAAYRKLTYSLHPDVTKTRDSEKDWIRVNEAYEVLSDPDAKYAYDKHGSVGKDQKKANLMEDPMSYTNFQSDNMDVDKRSLKEVNEINFEKFTSKDGEYLFLVYTSIMCPVCNIIMEWFETFKNEQSKYIRFGVIDAAISSDLAKKLGSEMMPSLIYINVINGTKKISISKKPIANYRSIIEFYTSQFKVEITQIVSDKTLEELAEKNNGASIVIQCVRNGPTAHFFRLANKYSAKYGAVFAFMAFPDYQSALKMGIKKLPQVLIYRSPSLPQITVDKMSKLDETLSVAARPLYWTCSGKTMNKFCKDECFIRFGYPQQDVEKTLQLNVSLGVIPMDSSLSNSFQLPEGTMMMVDRNNNVMVLLEMSEENDAQRLIDFVENDKSHLKAFEIPPGFIPNPSFIGNIMQTVTDLYERIPSIVKQIGFAALFMFVKNMLCGGQEPENEGNNEGNAEEQEEEETEEEKKEREQMEEELKKMRREFLQKDAWKDAEEAKKRSRKGKK